MPELAEIRAVVHEVVGEQTAQLSGEIQVNAQAIRDLAARASERCEANGDAIEALGVRVNGDSERPGLAARMADAEAKQGNDDDTRKQVKWALVAAKALAIPLFALVGWFASESWGAYQAIGDNSHQIDVVKTRLEHVEAMREQSERHHRELMEAVGGDR